MQRGCVISVRTPLNTPEALRTRAIGEALPFHAHNDRGTASSRTKNRSLLNHILIWMFGPLFLLWTIGLVITYFIAQNIANAPYDRNLTGHLQLLKYEVSQQDITRPISLSQSAHTVLQGDPANPIYWQIRDVNGHHIDGNAQIPLQENWAYENNTLRFVNDTMQDKSVRVAYVWGGRDQQGAPFLSIVAQPNEMRATLHQEILTGMLTPQLIVLPLAALLAGLGLTQGLEPLNILQERIRARRANDLSPIKDELAPAEIVPLLDAMNNLLTKQAASAESQQRFVANAAHQLKTPLAGMRMQAELALRDHNPDTVKASLEQLVLGSERAARLVNQMLALARAENSDHPYLYATQAIELNSFTEARILEWVSTAIHNKLDLGFEPYADKLPIVGNDLMLTEMLNNLIDNALRYTPANGRITVRTGKHSGLPYIEIEDSGPGISEEDRKHIFDRFYRVLGSSADGSGLGLSIVKEIAHKHRAHIQFISTGATATLNPGTCLRVSFSATPSI
jgi:two-component system sensor histidine kinase TctE